MITTMFTIEDIIRTLNNVEVKGKSNLDRMLSAITALEIVKDTLAKKDGVVNEVVTENGGQTNTGS